MNDETTPRPDDPHAAHRGAVPSGSPPRVGRYEVLRLLGGGTFGRVFLAFDPEIERYVAIKLPALPPESHRAFLREARAIADIHHPNVCPVYDVGTHDGLPYIVMRYVRGGTLNDVLGRGLPKPDEALRFAAQIAKGLGAAHSRGVIHRDLKPANVLSDDSADELLLTDFGLARWHESGTATSGGVKGTPAYMAPEQWDPNGRFGPVSSRTDVYSLGVVLFRLLTGVPLFTGSQYQLMRHHCESPPRRPSDVRPGLDPAIDELCLKALAKNPGERHGSAAEFANAIPDHSRPVLAVVSGAKHADRDQRRQITVPGTWYSRSTYGRSPRWHAIAETPAEVLTRPGEEYCLDVRSAARDADLAGLAQLRSLPTLYRLSLTACYGVADTGFAHVEALASLKELCATHCQVTGAALASLKNLAALHTLELPGCKQITDAGLAHLRSLAALQTLSLVGCEQITDAGLAMLESLAALRVLKLHSCPRVSAAGVAAFKRALPNCDVSR